MDTSAMTDIEDILVLRRSEIRGRLSLARSIIPILLVELEILAVGVRLVKSGSLGTRHAPI
jgi:hypothetical protein